MTETETELEAATREFEAHRPHLNAVAYRLLGRVGEADDVVQDAWLRWRDVDHRSVDDVRASHTRVTTRLAIDRLRREAAIVLGLRSGRIGAIYLVANPEKLETLQP
jgi:DNA-directed RNA polymerase specialized sigma24 family protein